MEMQTCIQQYAITEANSKTVRYSQGFIQTQKVVCISSPRQMKVLFSGCGKAEKNMGMAAIPPLCSFELKLPNN